MTGRHRLLLGLMGLVLSACSYGPDPDRRTDFVLFYHDGSTALDPAATAILERAAVAAHAAPGLDVMVAGYADLATTPEANQILSRIRAQTVADRLVQLGVARSRIQLSPRHAIGGDPGLESRRVEIRIGT